jgi:hypothetical protein
MKLLHYIFLLCLFVSCSSEERKPEVTSDNRELVPYPEKYAKDKFSPYPEMAGILDSINSTPNGGFYKLIPYTDSTCKIEWGNTKVKRVSKDDYHFHAARRFSLEWENKDFIVLESWTGSDSRFNVILPLDSLSKESEIWNPIAFNKRKNLIAQEGYGFSDTIVILQNIKTGKSQPIIDKMNKCESAFNHYCIDSISIQNKEVYIKWVLPHKMTDDFKVIEKRVMIKI